MKFPTQALASFNQAEIAIHRVCQLLALTGVNLVAKKADDSHTNLGWDANRSAVIGRYFLLNNQTMRFIFLLKERELCFETDSGQLVASISLDYSDHESLMMWWKMQLQELGVKNPLIDQLHYDLPDSSTYQTVEIEAFDEYLPVWMALRTQANQVFESLNERKQIDSEIRIWPHHFDTGVYYPIKGEVQAIGAGMAIADSIQPEPYYYLYGWAKDAEIDLSNVPDLEKGKCLNGDWKGLILPVSQLASLTTTKQVDEFLSIAFDFLKSRLASL
ncbi:MAG: hypothetical protein ACPGJS_12560 [Flammeovirgaceae bacterium]